jgi:hypothetical protein
MHKIIEKILTVIYILSLLSVWIGLLINQFHMITIGAVVLCVTHIICNLE